MKYVRSSEEELINRKVYVCVVFKVCVDTIKYRNKIVNCQTNKRLKRRLILMGLYKTCATFRGYPFFKTKK